MPSLSTPRMVLYSFSIYDRHCPFLVLVYLTLGECVYHRQWNIPTNRTKVPAFTTPGPPVQTQQEQRLVPTTNKHEDDAKLLFGVVYSLRNMTRKLSTPFDTAA